MIEARLLLLTLSISLIVKILFFQFFATSSRNQRMKGERLCNKSLGRCRMRLFTTILIITSVLLSNFARGQASESITIFGLELGSHKSIYHQLGISQSSFYLDDGNFKETLLARDKTERQADQIACKQSGFGIKKALSDAFRKQISEDDYLSSRKENLIQRIRGDLANAEVALINHTSKKYAQPECQWAFNSVQYAGQGEPTIVSKFKSGSGIERLTQLSMTFNHQGQVLAVSAEQIVERLDVDTLDTIIASIAKRYDVELESIESMDKTKHQAILEGKSNIEFETQGKSCFLNAKNTYYRSDAVASAFSIDDAHAYITMGCSQSSGLYYHERKLQEFVEEEVNKSMMELLAKHKAQMKKDGQKEKNSGFVF